MRHGCLLCVLSLACAGLVLAANPARPAPRKAPRHPTTAPSSAREDQTVLTTADLLSQSTRDLEEADHEMNRTYQQLLSMLDKEGKEKLKTAQRAWLKFRDAQAEFDSDTMRGGSAAGILDLGTRLELTLLRARDLEEAIEARR